MTTKEQFLVEHNKLSPLNLKATMSMLTVFKAEKPSLFKSNDWPVYKIRRPFIFWLTSMTMAKKAKMNDDANKSLK
ncbi:hypothetical protein COT95_02835 [Candidatus Falkowbacteria bacterium CG10_big_fil_rev_8_21_14_0_10_37_6]|uniref:Uncharacterized protein n=1 Tax=Candidatus Falkowbacteria bacterium CG10_big_fil_rev_8_21_14_0_10_37_6 TaxID=1974563 RepID=A0A2H0V6H0_9BACT|nr:MAG: hypothetical protein COT95_02835 [Candidatus Falkowbacteria bacterium CG10_big_fil_rev_8_21_14_0_10_37_6]